jgi:epoxyqueuosine reductase
VLTTAAARAAALRAGFHLAGVARAGPLDPRPLDRVLERGAEADMAWLRTQRAERLDPARLLPGARSVLALGVSYFAPDAAPHPSLSPLRGERVTLGGGRVARYARGRDYHAVVKRKLKALVADLHALAPGVRAFATCDVAPVMEKVWAERAGLGWIGKNGCLITERFGSWVLLATVLLDADLEPDAPHPERCGTCEACLPACPTGAIPEPGLVDARRCLSFWTIERRGPIPEEMTGRLSGWGFGCDDCQTVCPWNRRLEGEPATSEPDLLPRPDQVALDLDATIALTEADYKARYHGTSLARARHDGLVRNAILLAGEAGDPRRAPAIRAHLASPHEGVRAAAAWALARLGERGPTGPR